MTTPDTSVLTKFKFDPQPKAQALVNGIVSEFLSRLPAAQEFAARLKTETGNRFYDFIDSLHVPYSAELQAKLVDVGFSHHPFPGAPDCYVHEQAMFPQIIMTAGQTMKAGMKVESCADFAAAHCLPHSREIEGEPMSRLRRVLFAAAKGAELWAVERHGYKGHELAPSDPGFAVKAMKHLEALRRRQRDFADDFQGFDHAMALVDASIADLGRDYTCDLYFQTEREYWQRRNTAARWQKARQDRLGMGWANHDHHTYRSSRHCFVQLIALLEKLGFYCRERFYAGLEAGWGAQVLEQPTAGFVIFADVDMSAEEVLGDFSHQPILGPRATVGTVGLWAALHGEAMLQAGMHHLECQFDWHALKEQMEREGHIKTMDPFTTFPYLRQAFTEGERWAVRPERIQRLLDAGKITPDQAQLFAKSGAIGSHLENLERNDGYKGFNQQGVSEIIAKTDPRKLAAVGA